MNYFEWFGLEVMPFVTTTGLSRKYFELQKQYHPDNYADQSEQEQEMALKASAQINEAYNVLRNEEKTLEYFLQLKGQLEDADTYRLPADFLMEMMELNEELEENPAAASTAIDQFNQELLAEIAPYKASSSLQALDTEVMAALKSYYFKKKYLQRILDRMKE
jgi:molecular chaperone HscB